MEGKVGFGFRPTDDELVGYFLLNKIGGNTRLVESINEVDICSFDPWELRLQAKIKSRDPVWYFFSRRGKKYASGNQQSRKTSSGFWKLTGDPVDVKDQWGTWCGIPGKIGQKRVLGFHRGTSASSKSKGIKSDWVMHEYHYTLLSEDARTYVICRLEYKGDDRNMLTDNAIKPTPTFVANVTHSAGSVIDQSLQGNSGSYNTFAEYDPANQGQHFNGFFNMQQSLQGNSGSYNILSEYDSSNQDQLFSGNFNIQQSVQGNSGSLNHFSESEYDLANQVPWFSGNFSLPQQVPYSAQYEDESESWKNLVEQNYDALVDERTIMEENYNDYRPKNPVTGVLAGDSSDSDTDSMICGDAWSSADSADSSNGPYQTPIDDLLSSSTIKPLQPPKPLKLRIKEKVVNKQKKERECKMDEDSIKKTASANTVNENWIVLEEMNQRNSQWIYLKNMIIGFLLFISIIGWIILVG